jgi:hypothetical protein
MTVSDFAQMPLVVSMTTGLVPRALEPPHAMANAERNLTNNGSAMPLAWSQGLVGIQLVAVDGKRGFKVLCLCAFLKRHVIKRAEAALLTASGRMQRPRDEEDGWGASCKRNHERQFETGVRRRTVRASG